MSSHLDPFALRFDSIEIDPTRAPTPEAIERALAMVAPKAPETEAPGFYLVDDGGGRFVVDRDFGVISVKDAALLESERGQIHLARLRVVEQSGAVYELDMRLRINGRVPQMVGADEFARLSESVAPAAAAPRIAWTRYAAPTGALGALALGDESASLGGLFTVEIPAVNAPHSDLNVHDALPAPASARAHWSL